MDSAVETKKKGKEKECKERVKMEKCRIKLKLLELLQLIHLFTLKGLGECNLWEGQDKNQDIGN